MDAKSLFDEAGFAPASGEEWRRLAEKALAGAPLSQLDSLTDDGIRIAPLLPRAADARPVGPVRAEEGAWTITQRIDDPDPRRANRQALEDVENGATGLALVFEGGPNAFGYGLPANSETLEQVLAGIPLNRIHLRLDVHPASRAMADWVVEVLGRRRADPSRLFLSLGIDPAAIFAGTGRLRMSIEALQASMPQSLAHFFSLGVAGALIEADGRVFHNGGATEAQELGTMIAVAVAHLRLFEAARQPLSYASAHIGFSLSVDQDQFLSMAKIRALRMLWTRVQEACSITPTAAIVHAETSWRMLTRMDPETNILRNTIAAFAGAVGGADSIAIIPHTAPHGLPAPFARRLARNTQLILAEESRLGFVNDPGAGSGSIEALTHDLCEAAWAEFQQIESEGGPLKSLSEGRIQQRVVAARDRRVEVFRSKDRHLVGTTLYPPSGKAAAIETLAAGTRTVEQEGVTFCTPLLPARIDEMLETAQ